eukprot:462119-Hanusia_phi.AAC.1
MTKEIRRRKRRSDLQALAHLLVVDVDKSVVNPVTAILTTAVRLALSSQSDPGPKSRRGGDRGKRYRKGRGAKGGAGRGEAGAGACG